MSTGKDAEILRGVWLKAYAEYRSGEELTLPVMTKAEAYRLRFLLFKVAKVVREEGAGEVFEAVEALTLCMEGHGTGGQYVLRFRSKGDMGLRKLADVLGICKEVDAEAEGSLKALKAKLSGTGQTEGAQPSATNPFYRRD